MEISIKRIRKDVKRKIKLFSVKFLRFKSRNNKGKPWPLNSPVNKNKISTSASALQMTSSMVLRWCPGKNSGAAEEAGHGRGHQIVG